MAGFTLLALAVLGTEPFTAFFQYHLPRVRTGAAFAFDEVWPDFAAPLLAGNVSPFSLVRKLQELGVPGATKSLALAVHSAFSLLLLGAAVVSARVRSREGRALVWFGLINLAALTSPAAWGDYVPVGTLWMVTMLVALRRPGGVSMATLAVVGAVCVVLPGVVPIGDFPSAVPSMILSILTTLLLIGFNGRFVLPALVPAGVRASEPRGRVAAEAAAS
jgi:hypothetical protein